jgi:hypothetical protein
VQPVTCLFFFLLPAFPMIGVDRARHTHTVTEHTLHTPSSGALYPETLGGCAVFSGFLPFNSASFAARVTEEAKKVLVLVKISSVSGR